MPVEIISGAITAVSTLVDTIIKHVDKDPETRRLLNVQSLQMQLDDLSQKIDELIQKISEEEVTQ